MLLLSSTFGFTAEVTRGSAVAGYQVAAVVENC